MGCAKCGPVCNCHLQAGANVTVTGSGTRRDPWIVSATGGGDVAFVCADLAACSIHNLGDVSDTPPNPGDVLVWNGTAYVPQPPPGGFTCSLLASCTLNDLGDVNTAGALAGYILGFNGTEWVAVPPPGGSGFVCSDLNLCPVGALSDVDTTGVALGDTLVWNGTAFVPGVPQSLTCEEIQDCVGAGFMLPLVYNDPANQFGLLLSADAGNVAVLGTDQGVFVPPSGDTCPDDTEFLDVVTLCTTGGEPIGVVVERSCGTGAYTEVGWIDLGTGVFTAGAPPAGSGPCEFSGEGQVAEVHRAAPMSVTGVGADIAIAWDVQDFDTGPTAPGLWDPAFPTRLNAQAQGWWHVSTGVDISAQVVADTITSEEIYLRRNGDAADVWYPQANLSQSDALGLLSTSLSTGGLVFLDDGDYIEVLVHPLVAVLANTSNDRGACRAVWRFIGT